MAYIGPAGKEWAYGWKQPSSREIISPLSFFFLFPCFPFSFFSVLLIRFFLETHYNLVIGSGGKWEGVPCGRDLACLSPGKQRA